MLLALLYDGLDAPHDFWQQMHVDSVGGMDVINKCAPFLR
jgi:hypothetical protein